MSSTRTHSPADDGYNDDRQDYSDADTEPEVQEEDIRNLERELDTLEIVRGEQETQSISDAHKNTQQKPSVTKVNGDSQLSKTNGPNTVDTANNALVSTSLELDKLRRELKLKRDSEDQMRQVLKEYEKTISDLISEKENEKKRMELDIQGAVAEKNQAIEDLQNVEAAFSDVHRKYERTKQVVEGFKKNEEQLKQFVEEYKDKLHMSDQKYNMLKTHAEEKLEEANREIEKIAKVQDAEKAKLNALVQKSEMKVRNLERTVAQKTKENEVGAFNVYICNNNYATCICLQELTKICDELISKVGS